MESRSIQCASCFLPLEEGQEEVDGKRRPCPRCGEVSRIFDVEISCGVQVSADFGRQLKRPRSTSGKHKGAGLIDADETQRSFKLGRNVRVARIIDRDQNRYFEKITDSETGKIIREIDEKLTDHRGHGSAKIIKK